MLNFINKFLLPNRNRACLNALILIDNLFKHEKAYYPLVRKRVRDMLKSRYATTHILNYVNNKDYSPRQVTLCLIEACSLDLLSSGLYDADTMKETGESISAIYKIATEQLAMEGHYTPEEKAERLKNLEDAIRKPIDARFTVNTT